MSDATTRTGRLRDDLRAQPLFRQLVPMEAGIGYPIPVRLQPGRTAPTEVFARFPLFGMARTPEGGTAFHPPFATLTVSWRSATTVEYVDLAFSRPWPIDPSAPPVGGFPHEAVADATVEEYLADEERLFALYDGLFEALEAQVRFGDADRFALLLRRLTHPGLEPYLRLLAPRFYDRFLGPATAG